MKMNMKSFIIENFKDYQIKLPGNDEQSATGRTKLEKIFMKAGRRKAEDRVRRQKTEVGSRRSEVGGQKSEVRGRRMEVRGRKSEVGNMRYEKNRKYECQHLLTSYFLLLTSFLIL